METGASIHEISRKLGLEFEFVPAVTGSDLVEDNKYRATRQQEVRAPLQRHWEYSGF